jgi:hypothetical protein
MPIALTDDQLEVIMRHAEPLQPGDRATYLRRVASLLHGVEIGDGAVARAARQAQSELFRAPDLYGGAGAPKQLREFQQRASSAT